jgi:hypothetical protein
MAGIGMNNVDITTSVRNRINKHRETLITLSFEQLASKLEEIETSIIDDVIHVSKEYLSTCGCVFQDDTCSSKGFRFELKVEFISNSRMLNIKLYSSRLEPLRILPTISINHFGRIRDVTIEIPKQINIDTDFLVAIVQTIIKGAYDALEVAFEDNAKSLSENIFKHIQSILRMQLRESGKELLENRYCINICDEDIGFHCFDQPMTRRIIDHYKMIQHEVISPVELSLWLMTEPLPFQKSLSVNAFRSGRLIYQSWDNVEFGDASKLAKSVYILHGCEEYGVYPVCRYNDKFLSICFAKDISGELEPEIEKIKDSLSKLFTENIKNCSFYVRTMTRISEAITIPKHKDMYWAQFTGTVLGTIFSTVARPM